jgi:hypothetical protein
MAGPENHDFPPCDRGQHPKEANMSPQDVAPYFQTGSPTCPFPEGTLVGAPGVAQGGTMDAEVWLDVSVRLFFFFDVRWCRDG